MWRLIASAAAWAMLACGSSAPPPKASPQSCPSVSPKLQIIATERLNAADASEGRPVQLRIYQLRNDNALRNATFEEVWQNDQTLLKDDLLKREEHTIYPGKTSVVALKPNPEANKLAVVALFREPQGNDWFVTYELESGPTKPPCPKQAARIAVWLDRMQIRDGEGREAEPASTEAAPPAND